MRSRRRTSTMWRPARLDSQPTPTSGAPRRRLPHRRQPVRSVAPRGDRAGLVRVAFEREGHDAVLEHLATDISPRILRCRAAHRRRRPAARRVLRRSAPALRPPVDLQLAHGFRRDVLAHLRDIAYGATESYATWRARPGSPPRCGRRRARARTTRCRSSCRATASCAATERSASTSAAPRRRPRSSRWRRRDDAPSVRASASTVSTGRRSRPTSTRPASRRSARAHRRRVRRPRPSVRRRRAVPLDHRHGPPPLRSRAPTATSRIRSRTSSMRLRRSFWPHLLPIARSWADRRGKPAPWPDEFDEWLDECHAPASRGRRR